MYLQLGFFVMGMAVVSNAAEFTKPNHMSFGCLNSAYSFASNGHCALELRLDKKEAAKLKDATWPYFRSAKSQEFRKSIRQWRVEVSDLDDYYDVFTRAKPYALQFNKEMFSIVDDVLETSSRKKRFRELLTQANLRKGDFDCLMRMHDLDVDRMKFRELQTKLHEAHQLLNVNTLQHLELSQYRIAKRMLSTQIDADELARIAGEDFLGDLGVRRGSSAAQTDFDEVPLMLLSRSKVLVELEVTARQLEELRPRLKELRNDYNAKSAVQLASLGGNPKDIQDELTGWNKAVHSQISEVLNEVQLNRLRQLVFQHHLRSFNLQLALNAAERNDVRIEIDPLLSRWVQIEAFYESQIASFNQHYEILAWLVGERECRRLCGKVNIVHSLWRHHDIDRDEEILRAVQARHSFPPRRKPNPRRNPRR